MEHLVASILRASGYEAVERAAGPDGGVDIVAGRGELGFGQPRLCVQVKARRGPVGLAEYDRLMGNLDTFRAEHGLLVSLGGFTKPVRDRNAQSFFKIRLWGRTIWRSDCSKPTRNFRWTSAPTCRCATEKCWKRPAPREQGDVACASATCERLSASLLGLAQPGGADSLRQNPTSGLGGARCAPSAGPPPVGCATNRRSMTTHDGWRPAERRSAASNCATRASAAARAAASRSARASAVLRCAASCLAWASDRSAAA